MMAFCPAFHASLTQTAQEEMTVLSIFSFMLDFKAVVTVWRDLTGPDYYRLALLCDKVKDVRDVRIILIQSL